jgi:hypothetical protein
MALVPVDDEERGGRGENKGKRGLMRKVPR